jgi:hypothetical protein
MPSAENDRARDWPTGLDGFWTAAERARTAARRRGHRPAPPRRRHAGRGAAAAAVTRAATSSPASYGAQGELTAQLTSAAHDVAASNAFGPPLLAMNRVLLKCRMNLVGKLNDANDVP